MQKLIRIDVKFARNYPFPMINFLLIDIFGKSTHPAHCYVCRHLSYVVRRDVIRDVVCDTIQLVARGISQRNNYKRQVTPHRVTVYHVVTAKLLTRDNPTNSQCQTENKLNSFGEYFPLDVIYSKDLFVNLSISLV